jgi:hypothetical protein
MDGKCEGRPSEYPSISFVDLVVLTLTSHYILRDTDYGFYTTCGMPLAQFDANTEGGRKQGE